MLYWDPTIEGCAYTHQKIFKSASESHRNRCSLYQKYSWEGFRRENQDKYIMRTNRFYWYLFESKINIVEGRRGEVLIHGVMWWLKNDRYRTIRHELSVLLLRAKLGESIRDQVGFLNDKWRQSEFSFCNWVKIKSKFSSAGTILLPRVVRPCKSKLDI